MSPDLSSRFVLPRFLKDLPYNQICPPERCPGRTNLPSRCVLPMCPPDLSSGLSSRFVLPICSPDLSSQLSSHLNSPGSDKNSPKFTKFHLGLPFRTVSPGSRVPPGFPGPPGVRSQKVQRVIPSIQSVLPSEGDGESWRKLEKIR